MTTLKELLGAGCPSVAAVEQALLEGLCDRLGLECTREPLSAAETARARQCYDDEIGTHAFVAEIDDPGADDRVLCGTHTCAGGTVTSYLRLESTGRPRIGQVLITGDFFVAPPRTVLDLEAALRGAYVADLPAIVERFFQEHAVAALSVGPADFRASLEAAVAAAGKRA